ncbi:hypothetical protein [Streptomyces sp. KMM 9044]|uniref:hypothetical protein n=1 Tax=Streptomyces sp. KMM 9044 TaxID=2744474 RepID=UPI00215093A4|nr:hypothetical protein [Streptomyces sp. KMM 9044]WAX79605.1 hypothetical protein HUV60_019955 [Streptomyces sp. KMM 9044]
MSEHHSEQHRPRSSRSGPHPESSSSAHAAHYSDKDLQEEVSELRTKSATAARLFDIRRLIGALFVVYGVIVTIAGITASDADIDKAAGVNINLWTGLGMLALGLFFLVWLKLRPIAPPTPDVTDAVQEKQRGD